MFLGMNLTLLEILCLLHIEIFQHLLQLGCGLWDGVCLLLLSQQHKSDLDQECTPDLVYGKYSVSMLVTGESP